MPQISIIAAIDKNGLIGKSNHLPWKIKEDLNHFREITMGHPVVMGKKTWLSIGRPLDGRINIILTHDKYFSIPGCIIVNSIEQILTAYTSQEIFVIGGAEVFKQFLPLTSKIYLTRILHEFEGDTYFPDVNWEDWQIISYEKQTSAEAYLLSFEVWQRILENSISDAPID